MNICKRCGKENQEHYKFCLGCGGELTSTAPPTGGGAQKTMMAQVGGLGPLGAPPPGVGAATAPTPPGGVPALTGGPAPTGTPGLGVPSGLGGAPHSGPSAATYPGSGSSPLAPPSSSAGAAPFGGAPGGSPFAPAPGYPPASPSPQGGGAQKTMMAQVGGPSPAPMPPGAIPPPPGWGTPVGPSGFPPPAGGPGVSPYGQAPAGPPAYGQPPAPPAYQPPPGVPPLPSPGPSPAPSSFGAAPMSGQPAGGNAPGVPISQAAFGQPSSFGGQPGAAPPSFGTQPSAAAAYNAQAPATPIAAPGPGSGQVGAVSGGVRVCPNCGSEIPGSFQFCGACGTRLGAGAAVARTGTTGELASRVAPVAEPKPHGRLTLIRPDGSEGGQHELEEGENRIGRSHGPLFENDGYLSPDHAEVIVNAAGAVIRDLSSLNGVFCKMTGEEELSATDVFRIGQELLRYDQISPPQPLEDGTEIMGSPNPGYWGRLSVIIGKDIDGSAYPLFGDAVTIGRERGDINFPDDGYVSGVHARITQRDGKTFIVDLGSSNGTFIKLRGERVVQDGAFVLFGQQLFRVNMNVG